MTLERINFFIWGCCLLYSLGGIAQSEKYAVLTSLDADVVFYGNIVEAPDFIAIPLRIVNNLVLIEAEVEGQIGSFVLDTGAPYLVLNITYFRDKFRPGGHQARVGGITGLGQGLSQGTVSDLKIRQLHFRRLLVDAIPLGHIENSRGVKILGLLGLNLFKEFEMELDIQNAVMFLRRVNRRGEKLNNLPNGIQRSGSPEIISLLNVSNIAVMEVAIQGRRFRFCLDTAAEFSVLSSTLGNRILSKVAVKNRKRLVGAGATTADVLFGDLEEIKVGTHLIKNLPVVVTPLDHMSKAFDYHIDGMLGFDFLKRGVVWINLSKKEFAILYHDS